MLKRIAVSATALAMTIGPVGVWSMQNSATAAQGDAFTCRASAVRVEADPMGPLAGLGGLEPIVANEEDANCVAENAGVLNNQQLGPLGRASVLFANTQNSAAGSESNAGVADVTLTVPGAPVIRAQVLTARATAGQCKPNDPTPPTLASESTVARVTVGDQVIEIEDLNAPQAIDVGVGTLFLNQETFSKQDGAAADNQVTRRALFLDTDLVDVVIAEAIADFNGNPCDQGPGTPTTAPPTGGPLPECSDKIDNDGDGRIDFPNDPGCTNSEDDSEKDNGRPNDPGSTPPQCSDEIDNDGDGKIDFPNDPGCASPQDDNETDGSEAPQCSDGVDNDDDGDIDFPRDAGCESRDDDDETNNDNPECSDGVDNDRDGTMDFPADSGCKSASDDDEAAGFITGGGGYDEIDKKGPPEDFVNPGDRLRFSAALPCDVGDTPPGGEHLNTTFFQQGQEAQFKLNALTRAFCRNDPNIDPRNPGTEFDTYVGEGTGSYRVGGVDLPGSRAEFILIDRGEPGSPPVIGVDFYEIHVYFGVAEVGTGVGTLDEGNIQAHSPQGNAGQPKGGSTDKGGKGGKGGGTAARV